MLKKLLLCAVVAAASLFTTASAQRTELSISYGGYTQMDATNMHDGWHHVNNAWGALNVGLNFNVARNIWIGPSYTFSSTTTKGGPEHSSIAYHAVMLNGRYHYYRNSIVTLYAKLGLGVEFSYMQPYDDDNYTKAYCAYQIVPLGAQVSLSNNVALFGELGFGAQGVAQVGFKFGF
ncbi:MAG: porin family protein [Muribaculaceae bacterium]|nr:porin family protein [Muribaculaceae bacterium]